MNVTILKKDFASNMLEPDRNLPNETLVYIFSPLSQDDLTKVALVSHRFNAIAERVLYSSIDIAEYVTNDRDIPKRTLGWCDAMKRNQLYDVPRKLSIRWRIKDIGKSKALKLSHSCSLVRENIRRLTLLDTLELLIGCIEHTTPLVELIIRDLHLPNLRHCLLDADGWKDQSEPSICAFIASHSGLRYLAVLGISESALEPVPHDAVPELSIFHGTHSGAAFILPGRPVHHLLLTGMECILSSESLSRMALTSVPLRILDLSATRMPASILRRIATHLPTIEILRVKFFPDWLDEALPCLVFKKLNWFDLSPTEMKDLEMDNQLELCYGWHFECPSLRHIFFPFEDRDYDTEPYMWEWNEDTEDWSTCEPPTRESADGLYRYKLWSTAQSRRDNALLAYYRDILNSEG